MAPTPTSASSTFTLSRCVAFSKVSVFLVILKWVFVFLLRNEFGQSSPREPMMGPSPLLLRDLLNRSPSMRVLRLENFLTRPVPSCNSQQELECS
nr:hypothetical protein CFP56_66352 [Quercus suber]